MIFLYFFSFFSMIFNTNQPVDTTVVFFSTEFEAVSHHSLTVVVLKIILKKLKIIMMEMKCPHHSDVE